MKIFILCCCVLVLPFTESTGLKDVEQTLSTRFKNAKQYFLTSLNATVTDIVNKGIDDVKSLASQGFQALVLNYMNIRQKQKEQKASRDVSDDIKEQVDIMDRIISLLDASGEDLHYINKYLLTGLDKVTSEVTHMVTDIDTVKDKVEKIIKFHKDFLDKFVVNTVTAIKQRLSDHQGSAGVCPNCFVSVNRMIEQSLKPMTDGLKTIVTEAGQAVSRVTEMVLSPDNSSTQTTGIETFLAHEASVLSSFKDKAMKEMGTVFTKRL